MLAGLMAVKSGDRFGDEGIVHVGPDRRHGARSDSPMEHELIAAGSGECFATHGRAGVRDPGRLLPRGPAALAGTTRKDMGAPCSGAIRRAERGRGAISA